MTDQWRNSSVETAAFLNMEQALINAILPELEKGRPNFDRPHTVAVVIKVKEIIKNNPQLKLDEAVLIVAAYSHDWGYADLFIGERVAA